MAILIHKASSQARVVFSIYVRKLAEYVSTFGLLRGPAKMAEHFVKFKLAPAGSLSATGTPHHGNVILRAKTSDLSVYWEVFLLGEYDITRMPLFEEITSRYRDILARGRVPLIIDGGANIGITSIFFSSLFPDADFVLVEASKANADVAKLNAKARSRMEVLNRALWPSKTTLKLYASRDFSTLTVGEKVDNARTDVDVETVTMDELVASHPMSELFIAKMDIEGAENMVLAHNNGWLSQRPIIFVEPHDVDFRHNTSLAGLLAFPAYQTAEIVVNGDTLIFVPERMIPAAKDDELQTQTKVGHLDLDHLGTSPGHLAP
jgi:FkbM family methyltransferase